MFKDNIPPELGLEFIKIKGFKSITKKTVLFDDLFNIDNEDVTATIQETKKLLKGERITDLGAVSEIYEKFITNILSIGSIYSVFIEIVMCNIFLTKDNEILRHAMITKGTNVIIKKKLSIKRVHTIVSKLLGLLYEPNSITIYDLYKPGKLRFNAGTVFEKLW